LHSHVYGSIIPNSQDVETTQKSIDKQTDKENVVCIYIYIYAMGYYSDFKKDKTLLLIPTWMNRVNIKVREVRQT
jgi:hypothetical protein